MSGKLTAIQIQNVNVQNQMLSFSPIWDFLRCLAQFDIKSPPVNCSVSLHKQWKEKKNQKMQMESTYSELQHDTKAVIDLFHLRPMLKILQNACVVLNVTYKRRFAQINRMWFSL